MFNDNDTENYTIERFECSHFFNHHVNVVSKKPSFIWKATIEFSSSDTARLLFPCSQRETSRGMFRSFLGGCKWSELFMVLLLWWLVHRPPTQPTRKLDSIKIHVARPQISRSLQIPLMLQLLLPLRSLHSDQKNNEWVVPLAQRAGLLGVVSL